MSIVYDTVVSSYDVFNVSAPLSAYYTTIDAGGQQDVFGGGFAYEAFVYGTEYVGSGGSDQFSQVYSGGVEYVYSDGASYDADIYASGTEEIDSGGFASATNIYGTGYTYAGGVDSSTYIGGGGYQYVYGDSYTGTIATDGYQRVEAGGLAYETTDYWAQDVDGAAGQTYVESGATQYVLSGGLGYGTNIYSGGYQDVASGGTADNAYVSAGGHQYIESGGYASATDIYGYGTGYTYAGGVDSSTYIASSGVQSVYGKSDYATIATIGNQYVAAGGLTYEANDYWAQVVYGDADYTYVESDADQYIYSGGLGYGTDIYSGGIQDVVPGGTADYAFVYAGGAEYVDSDGSAYGTDLYGTGYTYAGGVNSSTSVESGGVPEVYGSSYYGDICAFGYPIRRFRRPGLRRQRLLGSVRLFGRCHLLHFGLDRRRRPVSIRRRRLLHLSVSGGGQYIYSGGLGYEAFVDSGGFQVVSAGGTAEDSQVYSGGVEDVCSWAASTARRSFPVVEKSTSTRAAWRTPPPSSRAARSMTMALPPSR